MRSRLVLTWDVALAAVGAVALITEGRLRSAGALSPAAYVLAIAASAPLLWRTRSPLAALVAVAAGAIVCAAAFSASWSASALVVVQLYTVGLLGHRQRSMVVGALAALVAVVAIVLIDGSVELTGIGLRLLLVMMSLVLGDTVHSRRALRAAARERAQREAHQREEENRRRLADERVRIARELHDTLAHSLVAISVRASVAADLQESQDPIAALLDIKQVSATALRDLRTTLGVLREPDDAAPTAPASDLESLPGLIENARAAGLRADAEVAIDRTAVPSAIGRAAFRIVQEALTNVLRHADASSALVRVSAGSEILTIEVTDDGRTRTAATTPGHGLRGMAERAAAFGGHLDTGPREEGGWRVSAQLPLNGKGVR
jgi:signal transduction histidine kinase